MKRLTLLCCAALLALPQNGNAIEPGPASKQQQETEGWLHLQSSNTAPSPTPQTASSAERELAMQRWLKSYEDQIPDFYDADVGGEISK